MLEAMRNASKTWLAKLLLAVLVLAFASWGITDYLSPSGRAPAITVGKVAYPDQMIRDQFVTQLNALRAQGLEMTTEQAVQAGLMDQVAVNIVRDLVYSQAIDLLGLRASDEIVRRSITMNPDFFGPEGRYDRGTLQNYLRQRGLSEGAFVENVRNQHAREYLLAPLAARVQYPDMGVRSYSTFLSERRAGEVLLVDAARLPAPKTSEASDADLRAIYERNIEAFTTPELRRASLLFVSGKDVEGEIEVTEADLRDFYDAHQDSFASPQRRKVRQSLFPSREQAEAARSAIAGGQRLEAATTGAGGSGPFLLGALSFADLPDSVARPVFSQPVGVVGDPLRSEMGWHLFLVESETPARQRSFDEAKADVRVAVVETRIPELMRERAMAIENELGGGASLEEAGALFKAPVISVVTDIQGRDRDGKPVTALPEDAGLLRDLFAMSEQDTGMLTEFDGGYYAISLTDVTPATPKPLEAVRDQVLALWAAETRVTRARALGEALLEKARAGESFARISRSSPETRDIAFGPASRLSVRPGAETSTNSVLETRGATPDSLPILDAVFETKPGEIALVQLPQGAALVRVSEVLPPDPTQARVERETVRSYLDGSFARDIARQFDESLARTVGYSISRDRLEKIVLQEF